MSNKLCLGKSLTSHLDDSQGTALQFRLRNQLGARLIRSRFIDPHLISRLIDSLEYACYDVLVPQIQFPLADVLYERLRDELQPW